MEARVDAQAARQLAVDQQRLAQHGGQEGGGGVVVAEAGDLDGELEPVDAASAVFFILVSAGVPLLSSPASSLLPLPPPPRLPRMTFRHTEAPSIRGCNVPFATSSAVLDP